MRRSLLVSLRMAVVTIVAFGVIYPLAVWAVGRIAFPEQASGSLITRGGQVIGSRLIGQQFDTAEYFHGRPSAAGDGYDAMASSASNLGPTSRALFDLASSRVVTIVAENPGARAGEIPVDLVTASGSGLDPDISPDAANLQVARVARARGIAPNRVEQLVSDHVVGRQFGFLGEPRVNVLALNLALDELSSR